MSVRRDAEGAVQETHYIVSEYTHGRISALKDGMDSIAAMLEEMPDEYAPPNRYMAALWYSMATALEAAQGQAELVIPLKDCA